MFKEAPARAGAQAEMSCAWGHFMQDRESELRRIPIPRTRVNTGHKKGRSPVRPRPYPCLAAPRHQPHRERQLHRGAYAQEDAAKTLRGMRQENRKLAKEIGHEVCEGMNKNFERGLRTNRSMDASDARRLAHKLAGGARISRAI
jgi:hypothetical protein